MQKTYALRSRLPAAAAMQRAEDLFAKTELNGETVIFPLPQ